MENKIGENTIPENTIPEKSTIKSCIICNKVSIYNMSCRCSKWTCKRHRDPCKHNCTFDFTEHCRNTIKTNNPKVETPKITTI